MAELDGGAAGGSDGGGDAFAAISGAAAGAGDGGGEDGGTAAAAAAAAAGAAGDGGGDPAWYADLSADTADGETASLRDWVKAQNANDLNGLAKIARDNQRALRESGRVKVPGEGASPEEVAAWRTATGVPDSPAGYALEPVKDAAGADVPLDAPLLERLAARAHELGMPKAQYQGLVQDFVAAQMEQLGSLEATMRADAAEWMKGQGDKQPARAAAVNRGAEFLGLAGEDVVKIRNELGSAKTLNMLAKLGEASGEDMLLGGTGSGRFLTNGNEAQAAIDGMRADPIVLLQITKKGTPENAKYERLSRIVEDAANRKVAAGQ